MRRSTPFDVLRPFLPHSNWIKQQSPPGHSLSANEYSTYRIQEYKVHSKRVSTFRYLEKARALHCNYPQLRPRPAAARSLPWSPIIQDIRNASRRDFSGRSSPFKVNNKTGHGNEGLFSIKEESERAEGKGRAVEEGTTRSSAAQLSAPSVHRPTREELLTAATGFWSRLKIRFKWFSIRSARPFNADEIGAFFSWLLLGHVLWIILGTTTFFSLAIFTANTVFAQETLARWVGQHLTKSSGVRVVFESAIVPKWKDGVISFRNVFISRRPGKGKARVQKGILAEEAALAAATIHQPHDHTLASDVSVEPDNMNFAQYDLSVDTINVTLSFRKWINGKGLLQNVEVKGVRGVLDRTSICSELDPSDPRTLKQEHSIGDFEIDSFKLEDLLITVHQPGGFRPFSVSIYNCDLSQLRRQWLFYDVLSANMMSGSFDESLFTIHPAQTHGSIRGDIGGMLPRHEEGLVWKKQSRLRIDGLNVDHLNRGVEGPFSWIRDGNVDIIADVKFPLNDEAGITKVINHFYEKMATIVTSSKAQRAANSSPAAKEKDIVGTATNQEDLGRIEATHEDSPILVLDLRVHLNDIRAAVPLFTKDLSYVNNALVRPIVAYMNSRKTFIPINCQVVKHVHEFDGSWTIFDSGLMDDISADMYQAFAKDVMDDQARLRRLKKVGLWSLQLAAQALFMGLAGNLA